jgi:hypothetical protein
MTTDKALKRAVRTRMQKTGERYAAARRHVALDAPPPGEAALPPRVADPGMTDESILKGTGRDWDAWLRDLDAWGATDRTHTEIARHVQESFEINGWWAQAVTVGYERARGMRAKHQTTRGFEVSVSRTVAAPPEAVWPALVETDRRDGWVGSGELRLREGSISTGRSARYDVPEDDTRVGVFLIAKGDAKTTVTVVHERLAGPDDVAARRTVWRARLDRLAASLAGSDATSGARRGS